MTPAMSTPPMAFMSAALRFYATLAFLLLTLLMVVRPQVGGGDAFEYGLTTIAIASHGTPDIRPADVERGKQLLPMLSEPFARLEETMGNPRVPLYQAFVRGKDGAIFSVHFFGYPALAALPYKVLDLAGLPPFYSFHIVNLAAIFLLGVGLYRLFGSPLKALLGVGLFMLCGGSLYWTWSSPECVSACALLAGMLFYMTRAPLAAAVLAGIASQQNPTIVIFFGFAPLLHLLVDYDAGTSLQAKLVRVLQKRYVLALGVGLALFAVPTLFNLWQFGVPNIIAKLYSDPALIGLTRLHSFYFDLNQGMVLGIPGVLLALALWGWRRNPAGPRRELLLLSASALFTLLLALPSLAVHNWNSGAAGIMRYGFWASMPFLFVLLLRLRQRAQWPAAMLAVLFAVQGVAMYVATTYGYTQFSPLARFVLKHAPGLYHPEPEIFAERTAQNDAYIYPSQVVVRAPQGEVPKTLYNARLPGYHERVCGVAAVLAPDQRFTQVDGGWRYIDGPVRCLKPPMLLTYRYHQFLRQEQIKMSAGWAEPESYTSPWEGVWSEGAQSRMLISLAPGARLTKITFNGIYLPGNVRTRVKLSGVNMGWQRLDRHNELPVPLDAVGKHELEIILEHEAPQRPAGGADQRMLAYFLREISIQ